MFQLNVVPAIFNALALKLLSSPLLMVVASRTVSGLCRPSALLLKEARGPTPSAPSAPLPTLDLTSLYWPCSLLHRWRRSRC